MALTDAEAHAIYEAYFRAQQSGSVAPDLSDAQFYLPEGQSTADTLNIYFDLAAAVAVSRAGIGTVTSSTIQSVRQIAERLAAQHQQSQSLASEPQSNFTDAELQSRATALADKMIADFDAAVVANAAAAAYLPSTDAQKTQFRTGVQQAMQDMADVRAYGVNIANGNASAQDIGLAVAAGISASASILKMLPMPPAAKAAVNVVGLAADLVPAVVAASKGNGDPAALLTIGLQMAASIVSWGASDYFFDYVAPIIVSAAVDAELGANGLIDLSPTKVTQGLIEAAVVDNGGTLPDWWHSATGGASTYDPNNDPVYDSARAIADAVGGYLTLYNGGGFLGKLHAQLNQQYAGFSHYYQVAYAEF